MASNSVLVLGAGELGIAVLRSLASHPDRKNVRLAVLKRQNVSQKAEADELQSLGVDVLIGDLVNDSADQLSTVFNGFHTVVGCSGMAMPPGTQLKIANAVIQSSAKRYFPWQWGISYDDIGRQSSQDLFDEQLDVRDRLRGQSSLSWTIVSTGMFTSFLFEPTFGLVNAERTVVTAIGSWDNKCTVTTPTDIGKVAAELVLARPEIEGIVYTAGDTVSMQQLADIVSSVKQSPVERILKTVPQLKEELAQEPSNGMKKYQVVFGEGIGTSWDKKTSFNETNGIVCETAEEWARQNL